MPVEMSQQLRLGAAFGHVLWHCWSDVHGDAHTRPPLPVVEELPLPPTPDVDVVPPPVVFVVLNPLLVVVVVVWLKPLAVELSPPIPPPVDWVSLPDAHEANAAGVTRAK